MMKPLPQRLYSFIKHLRTLEHAGAAEREKAALLLTEALDNGKSYVLNTEQDIRIVTDELKAARIRLEDIHSRLEISLKSGLAKGTVH